MEVREAGEKGSFMASDYIASLMGTTGLKPYGDMIPGASSGMGQFSRNRSFFQTFNIICYATEKATPTLISQTPSSSIAQQLSSSIDFEVVAGIQSIKTEALLVFAGYCKKRSIRPPRVELD